MRYGKPIRVAGLLGLVWCCAMVSRSQELLHPVESLGTDTVRVSHMGFERQLNTFLWNAQIGSRLEANGLRLSFAQNVHSRLIRTTPQTIQDEYYGWLNGIVPLGDQWTLEGQWASSAINDNRSFDLSKIYQHRFLAGAGLAPAERISLRLLAGYEFDGQVEAADRGPAVVFGFQGTDIRLEEFVADFQTQLQRSFLGSRNPLSASATSSVRRALSPGDTNTLTIRYSRLDRDFYTAGSIAPSGAVSSRQAQELEVGDAFHVMDDDGNGVGIEGGVLSRTIDRSTDRKDFTLYPNSQLDTRIQETQYYGVLTGFAAPFDWLMGDMSIAYSEREERHSVTDDPRASDAAVVRQQQAASRRQNVSRKTTLASRLRSQLSSSHLLTFLGSASILRYDTPDEANTDDRDELYIAGGVKYDWRVNSWLLVSLSADIRLNHLVYLSKYQSANNNWNRVIRLAPSTVYTPAAWFRTANTAEVLANYTVFDFEQTSASIKSYSFRHAAWLDTTAIAITRRLTFEFTGTIRVYNRGLLNWREFSESLQNSFLEQTYAPRFLLRAGTALRMGIGYRYFSQKKYRYNGKEKIFDRIYETGGPTTMIEWSGPGGTALFMDGWMETQRQDGAVLREISNLSIKLSFIL